MYIKHTEQKQYMALQSIFHAIFKSGRTLQGGTDCHGLKIGEKCQATYL